MLELESRRGGEGRLVIQRQRDSARERESRRGRGERERESGDNVNSSAPSTVSWNLELSSEARRGKQTKLSSVCQTRQTHGIWSWSSKKQKRLRRSRRCRIALNFSCNFFFLLWSAFFHLLVRQHRDGSSLSATGLKWVSRRYLIWILILLTLPGHCEY